MNAALAEATETLPWTEGAYCVVEKIEGYFQAQADLTRMEDGTWWVARVIVPQRFRGRGYGTKVMRRVAEWADAHGFILILEARPYDGEWWLDRLIAFYEAAGFCVDAMGVGDALMTRFPQPAFRA